MDKFFRKYVWDEQRTPYLVPVARLSRTQAGYEILAYSILTGVLFALIALAALSNRLPHGNAQGVSLFAFTQVCAALLLGTTRGLWVAFYCATAPLAALLYFALFGFHAHLELPDKTLLVGIMVLWAAYCTRLVAVARAYPTLPDPSGTP